MSSNPAIDMNPALTSPKTTILKSLLLILGLVLFLDGAILIFNKKIHLGTVLPLLIGTVFCGYAIFTNRIKQFLQTRPTLTKLWTLAWAGFFIWALSLLGFFIYLERNIDHTLPQSDIDTIIVLGSGVIQGQASPTLALRLDRAAELAQLQPKALIVVTGGLDYGEVRTEAQVMSDYLQQKHHINAARIILEDRSTSTALNLKNTQKLLEAQQLSINIPIAIVTSDFHSLRAAAIARKQGYSNLITVSSVTPLETRYNAWLREYFAYMSGWLLKEY